VGSTTSTTLQQCSGSDCPCFLETTFASIGCRLDVLQDSVPEMTNLGNARKRLGRLFHRSQSLLSRAEGRCQAAKSGASRRKLHRVERRLRKVLRVLRVKYERRVPPPREVEVLTGTTNRLLDDTGALAGTLTCP